MVLAMTMHHSQYDTDTREWYCISIKTRVLHGNRPVFHCKTFFVSDTSGIMTLSDARDVTDLAQRFLAVDPCHVVYCSNVHRALLASGDIRYICLCSMLPTNTGWLCCYSPTLQLSIYYSLYTNLH